MHIEEVALHGYANRGLDLRIAVTTVEAHTDFTAITFRAGEGLVTKAGLTAVDTPAGFDVDLTLTAAEMSITPDVYRWELLVTFGGQVRTLVLGDFTVGEEPT